MIYFEEALTELDAEIKKLRIEGTSSRLSALGDHDYIVGTIDGLTKAHDIVLKAKRKMENVDEFDDEGEDGEFSAEGRKNVRRRFS